MPRLFVLLVVIVVCPLMFAKMPLAEEPMPPAGLPAGKWNVEFANGVNESVEIGNDAAAKVVEPLRASAGKVTVNGTSLVIKYEDDRIERWTLVGKQHIVEHWFPGSQLPTVTPILGIAQRAP